ncbi:glycosyltransferase family 2 protein [Fibrobacter intestinalis]|uniref:Glycosyltransferase, GT2 family n=1 Tax=Fibrobacter intestinalis TaxID=28122 RepID=A0A1T4M4Z5_9BACT|nr:MULTISPECIES: glycosyltransferase family 2 protein [Fibrobacter]PBC73462.1 hypothetical protein BGW94_1066 [Fibrobacter sp. NR9]SJZ61947.1 Glycosyltransferase, GT2 family [Fibrobacter intestinalis]
MNIDVGIINYNGGDELTDCVRSLAMQTMSVRIFVFDNASVDDSISKLQNSGLSCQVISSDKNLGYAGACNKLLDTMDAEIQVLCNMDLEFDAHWAEHLLACFARHPDAGSVASLVMEKSGVVNAVGVLFGPDLFAENEASGLNISEADVREKEVFGCYGAVMSFRKEAAQAVGRMDASFFLFFEETEWYFRHQLAGFKTVFCPDAKVFHERSKTTVRYSPKKLFYSERNRLRSALRLLPAKEIAKLPFYAVTRYLSMAKKTPSRSGDGKKLSTVSICTALAKAWIQAMIFLPAELKTRCHYRQKFGDVNVAVMNLLKTYVLN